MNRKRGEGREGDLTTMPQSCVDDLIDDAFLMPDLEPSSHRLGVEYPSRTVQSLRAELDEMKRRDEALQDAIEAFRAELRLAGSLQRDLLRKPHPRIRGARLEAVSRPVAEVSGDVLDVLRVDDENVALVLADATGHGFAAGLLGSFVQHVLSGRRVEGGPSDRLRPGAMLALLNKELLGASLHECHFVTAIYAVFNERTRTLQWARAGAPYPLLQRFGQTPAPLVSEGILLGVRAEATFPTKRITLSGGDTVVFHTDGVDSARLAAAMMEADLEAAWAAADHPDDVSVLALHLPTE